MNLEEVAKAFDFPDLFDCTLWNIFQKIQNLF